MQKSDAIADLHVRRRRGQSRAVPGRAELGGAVQAAGAVRVRGQRRRGLHARRKRDRRTGRHRRAPRRWACPAITVDGNNATAVDDAASRLSRRCAAARVRTFCTCSTYRITGHTSTDAAAWRAEGSRAWRGALARSDRAARRGAGGAGRSVERDSARSSSIAKAEMAEARSGANAAPWPEPAVAFEDVQDTGAVAWSR